MPEVLSPEKQTAMRTALGKAIGKRSVGKLDEAASWAQTLIEMLTESFIEGR